MGTETTETTAIEPKPVDLDVLSLAAEACDRMGAAFGPHTVHVPGESLSALVAIAKAAYFVVDYARDAGACAVCNMALDGTMADVLGGVCLPECPGRGLRDVLARVTFKQPCRRCSECEGEAHHLMGPEPIGESQDVGFACKHCDYTTPAEECAECEQLLPVEMLQRAHGNGDLFCTDCIGKAEGSHAED